VPKLSAGLLLYRVRDGGRRSPDCASRADRSGLARTTAPGRFRRAKYAPRRRPLGGPRSGNSKKRSARRRLQAHASIWAPVKQPGGKVVTAFAVPGDLDPAQRA